MRNDIRIRDRAACCTIEIEGTIGLPETQQFADPAQRVATYEAFRAAVRRIGAVEAPEVVVHIRSTGGDVNDALLIYEALRALPARVTTRCYGYTASAATLIAQAASEGCREIVSGALYLIHSSVSSAEGNAAELESRAELLRQTDRRLAAIYAARSGRSEEEMAALMAENGGSGRWLAPDEAVAAGLADRVVAEPGAAAPAAGVTARAARPAAAESRWRGWVRRWRTGRFGPGGPRTGGAEPGGDPLRSLGGGAAAERAATDGAAAETCGGEAAPLRPTRTQPREDPAVRERLPTPNERAYADDARRLAGR